MSSWINQFGALNPQFLRECRGRLKLRSVMAAIGLSVLFQLLLVLSAYDRFDEVAPLDWVKVVTALSWTIPYALFALGSYYIVDDLTQEARTGTLNFIRLSPRPAQEILLGKLIGAPVLPLVLVLAVVPLHIVSAFIVGLSPWLLLSYYLIVGSGMVTVFILALLVGLSSGSSKLTQQRAVSAIAFAGLTLFSISPIFMLWNAQFTWQTVATGSDLFRSWGDGVEWLYLDIGNNPWFAHLFVLGNLAGVSAIAWRMAVRKFRVPQATLLSKRLSYVGVAYVNLVGWGFAWASDMLVYQQIGIVIALYFANVVLFLGLIFALAPSRQMLLDWVRYRTSRQGVMNPVKGIRDWIWSEGSPSVIAIAINFAIAAALIVPSLFWFVSQQPAEDLYAMRVTPVALLFAVVSMGISVLTYATLVQVIFSRRLRTPIVWAAGCVAVLAIVPPLALLFLRMSPDVDRFGFLWTFLGLPLLGDAQSQVPWFALVGLMGQLCFLGFLLNRLNENLRSLAVYRSAVEGS